MVLSVFTGFFLGILTGVLSLQENSGLAGGAIIFMGGLIGAGLGLIASLFFMNKISGRRLRTTLWVLTLLNLLPLGWVAYRLLTREDTPAPIENRPTTSSLPKTALALNTYQNNQEEEMGLGMARPNFFEKKVLYFYNGPNLQKGVDEHIPNDSVVFRESDHHRFDITYAPPWFLPQHLKMDYEIIFLKALAMNREWVQVEVNRETGLSSWVDQSDVEVQLWPEFLLRAVDIEILDPAHNPPRIKPLDHASPIGRPAHSFLRPVMVKDQWLKVELLDNSYEKTGEAWIRWRDGNRLLVSYSLLS